MKQIILSERVYEVDLSEFLQWETPLHFRILAESVEGHSKIETVNDGVLRIHFGAGVLDSQARAAIEKAFASLR